MQEVRIIKENIIEIKESLNNGPNNNLNSADLRITNPELINGKKFYIGTLDDIDKMETELEDAEFFEKVVRTIIVSIYSKKYFYYYSNTLLNYKII